MSSSDLNKVATALIRETEKDLLTHGKLAENVVKLLRLTAIQNCDYPDHAIMSMRNRLAREISALCIVDSLVCRVLHLLNGGDLSGPNLDEIHFPTNPGSALRADTNTSSSSEENSTEQDRAQSMDQKLKDLVKEVSLADKELAEQLATCITVGDHVMILGEKANGFVEDAIINAAADMTDQNKLKVTVLRIQPDFQDLANKTSQRLRKEDNIQVNVVNDVNVLQALKHCTKVMLTALAVDVDEGPICYSGATLLTTAAYSTRRPVIVGMPRHRILPRFSGCVEAMCTLRKLSENIMAYEETRCEENAHPIVLTGTQYDIVALNKVDTIVTEFGGYAPPYVKDLIGGLGSPSDAEDGVEVPSIDGDGSSEEDSDEQE